MRTSANQHVFQEPVEFQSLAGLTCILSEELRAVINPSTCGKKVDLCWTSNVSSMLSPYK